MKIITIPKGIFSSNTYILSDNGECAVVDCGVEPDVILKTIQENGFTVRYILLTHGHVDHITYADALKKSTGAVLCIHEEEMALYSDPTKNGCVLFGFGKQVPLPKPDRLLKHGDRLPLGNTALEIIHTPGHSPGSISILCGKILLTGDTLFSGGVGRTDLYGGSAQKLAESILNRLFTLDGDITVYPGHGPETTIAFERENNPYV